MRKNVEVVMDAWHAGKDKGGESISTRDGVVYSYAMPILAKSGSLICRTRDNPTATTGQHMSSVTNWFIRRGMDLDQVMVTTPAKLRGFITDSAAFMVAEDAEKEGNHLKAAKVRAEFGIASREDYRTINPLNSDLIYFK